MDLINSFFTSLLDILNVSELNARVVLSVLAITIIGEANIAIPLLLELIWLLIGYQSRLAPANLFNAILLLVVAQTGRQMGLSAIYCLFPVINKPLSRLYTRPLHSDRFYKKFAGSKYYDMAFLTPLSATIGMMTPLNGAIKFLLIWKRRLRTLLLGTLFSGMAFDLFYFVIGAIFGTTSLNLAFMPLFLLVGFLILIIIRLKVLK